MTAIQQRRLSESTHRLAEQALDGTWGRALVDAPLALDASECAGLSPDMQYALGVRRIAAEAPLRIVEGELLAGSATLALAPRHRFPLYLDGEARFDGTSHLTPGFDHVLKVGYRGVRAEIEERLAVGNLDEAGADFLRALQGCLEGAAIWHARYLEALDARLAESSGTVQRNYSAVRANLGNVPENPSTTFAEAVQALWFLFAFQRLCGNWPGIGRIDEMLGPYLRRDLDAGRITLDAARELLAHFWIKGCEWIGAQPGFGGSGDAQHYQNIVLAGIDVDGREVTCEVTYLVLDVVEELRVSDFPIAVRISSRTPPQLLRRIAEVQRLGGGIVAVYNEDLVIESLTGFGYDPREARRFANDGCWEVQIPGETCFLYHPFDMLRLLQEVLGVPEDGEPPDFTDFDALYSAFHRRLADEIAGIHERADRFALAGPPAPLVSLLERDCIAKARGYWNRGARYTVYAPHAGGVPDTANSLLAIKTIVYEQRAVSLPVMVRRLRENWAGHEEMRLRLRARHSWYGNDDWEADGMVRRVFDDYLALVGQVPSRCGVLRPPGVSTFGREIGWRSQRGATADGHLAEEILATNLSPSPGTDTRGPTAVIRSHCALDLRRLPNGTALELFMMPDTLQGEAGTTALVGLLRTFVELGGFFLHIDAVSPETLREAQQHPERHRRLAVRVSGWSARFVTLDSDWQEMIIHRTRQVI